VTAAGHLELAERILWVDDNADMRDYVRRLLASRYQVHAVSDGEAALAAARDRPPDLVLADAMMPGLDGFELLRELRADPRTKPIPVILLSARAGEESRVAGLAAGADDYVVKPFSAHELLARVEAHLRMARFRREASEELRKRESQLAAEAEALTRLNDATSRLWRMRSLGDGLHEMLAATMQLLGAAKGNVQLLDRPRNVLVIAAQRGFAPPFLDFFREVSAEDDSACGRALRAGARIVIEDVEADAGYAPLRAVAREAGYRAVQSTPLLGYDGTPLGMISTHFESPHRPGESDLRRLDLYARQAADFVERCAAEEAGARMAAIVDSSDDAIVGKTLDGVITSWNRGAQRMFGYTAAEAVGRHITLVVPEDRHAEEHEVLARLRRGERIEHFTTERRAKDGRRIIVSLTVSPIRDAAGRIVGASMVARDITERELALERRRRDEHNARFLAYASAELANLSDYRRTLQTVARLSVPAFADWCAVDVLREDGTLERVAVMHSDAGKEALAAALQRAWPDRSAPRGVAKVLRDARSDWSPDIPESLLQAFAADEEHRRLLHELGPKSYICVPVRSRRDVAGALTFVTAESGRHYTEADVRVAEDLAYRVSVAIENASLYQALQQADRRKDEFLATLSHELRTPLNAIVGWTHVLRESAGASDTARKAAEIIHRNALAQNQLISDILEVSRIVAGKVRLDIGPVDLGAVIQAAIDAVQPAAEAKHVQVELALDPKAGPITGDPERLQQVAWNLLSNAIKFAPAHGGRIQVRLEAAPSHVRLTVEDNGPGIAADFLPYVFDRFQQADSSSTRKHGGLGLGLAIVRHLVELHGGTVRADNRAGGHGAIFTVELRRRTAAATASPAMIERLPRAEEAVWLQSAPSLRGLRILVVDDEPDARDLVAMVLERCGAQVTAVSSAREGLHVLSEARPDVLLSDIEMPEQNGYDFLRQVRHLPAERGGLTPAAALTAYASTADRMKTLEAGFQIHVPKPVQPPELVAVVASLVRGPGLKTPDQSA
jgi:PAS domain S-box-containing protein